MSKTTNSSKSSKNAQKSNAPAKAVSNTPVAPQVPEKTYKVKQNLDPRTIVTVVNGHQGPLVYKSPKTGETIKWEEFGSEQDMELQDLKSAKNSNKKFFVNNWFLIDDPEILEYLGVSQYYKYALNFASFDDLFTKTPKEIANTIKSLSKGQKKSVTYRAKQLIAKGEIDSIKVIKALEESLGVELIDRDE